MEDPIAAAVKPSTPHEIIVSFLNRELGMTSAEYDALYARMIEWAAGQSTKACVNEFNPIMLLEQVRREFDDTVPFVQFALVAADLQWGPRMLKLGDFDKPVWVVAIEGFPAAIAAAQAAVEKSGA